MTRLEDIHPGNLLTGRVSNVTAFGAFVDIGELKNVFFKLSFQFHGF
jgi:ribosomal protein S1